MMQIQRCFQEQVEKLCSNRKALGVKFSVQNRITLRYIQFRVFITSTLQKPLHLPKFLLIIQDGMHDMLYNLQVNNKGSQTPCSQTMKSALRFHSRCVIDKDEGEGANNTNDGLPVPVHFL